MVGLVAATLLLRPLTGNGPAGTSADRPDGSAFAGGTRPALDVGAPVALVCTVPAHEPVAADPAMELSGSAGCQRGFGLPLGAPTSRRRAQPEAGAPGAEASARSCAITATRRVSLRRAVSRMLLGPESSCEPTRAK